MSINDAEYIKNCIQGEKMFKFFEKSPKRNTLKTPPPKRRKSDKIILNPVQRRSTRLKTDAFLDNMQKDEYDITKVDLNSSKVEYEPLKRRNTLTPNTCDIKSKADLLLDVIENKNAKRSHIMLKQPLRRSTRLKSEIFVDSSLKDALYSNMETKKVDNTYLPLGINKVKVAKRVEKKVITQKKTDDTMKKPQNPKYKIGAIQNVSADTLLDRSLHNNQMYVNGDIIAETPTQLKMKQPGIIRKVITNKNSPLKAKSCKHDGYQENKTRKKNSLKCKGKTPSIKTSDIKNLPSDMKPVKALVQTKTRSRKQNTIKNNKNDKSINFEGQDKHLDKITNNSFEKDIMLSVIEASNTGITNTSKRKETDIQTFNGLSLNMESKQPQEKKKGKQQVSKNRTKQHAKKNYTKLSKLTKKQIKDVDKKKIPRDRLIDVLDIIDNNFHPIWDDRNASCNLSIHLHWEPKLPLVSDQNMKVKYARQFLLQRDWVSLSKILCLSNSAAKSYYPLLSKYAALLLAHTDKEQFNTFTQFLASIDDSTIMKKCTKI